MNFEDIRRTINVGLHHSIEVDAREVAEAPGTLKTVTIHRPSSASIEFERCEDYARGEGEGAGLKYVAQYSTLEDLVRDLEEYLESPMESWRNYSLQPLVPECLQEPDYDSNMKFFESLVRDKKMHLPPGASYELAGIYWRHIDMYGEYRPDKLGEETDIALDDDEQ